VSPKRARERRVRARVYAWDTDGLREDVRDVVTEAYFGVSFAAAERRPCWVA
jgi:hypothetical protein